MITFSHPLAPTVSYDADIGAAILCYAQDHLPGYHVHVVAAQNESHGVVFEVLSLESNSPASAITIH